MLPINDKSVGAAYGLATAVSDKIYVHGGIKKHGDLTPLSDLYYYDCLTDKWFDIPSSVNCPSLSYHACYVTEDRFINVVGGWNGKARTSDVYVFDTRHQIWLDECRSDGFPIGAGLSSHTVTPLTSDDAVVVGRLGGLKMQRKCSSVLLCKRRSRQKFEYNELPLVVASRSGHSCLPTSSNGILLIGGRDGKEGIETVQIAGVLRPETKLEAGRLNLDPVCNWRGRKYHCTVLLNDQRVFNFGGEYCSSGVQSEPLADAQIYSLANDKWYNCRNLSLPKLTGHRTVILSGRCFVLGGFTDKWKLSKCLYELKLS